MEKVTTTHIPRPPCYDHMGMVTTTDFGHWRAFCLQNPMAREWTENELKLIMHMGALHYGPKQIADNFDDADPEELRIALLNPDSSVAKAYQKGKSRAQFKIDTKLSELAQQGDLEALKQLERRQRENDQANFDPRNRPDPI